MNNIGKGLYTGVLFINLGTPKSPTYLGTMSFLRQFLSDKNVIDLPRLLWLPILYGFILPFRSYSSAKNYKRIWNTNSPLMNHSLNFIESLKVNLKEHPIKVEIAMTYGSPTIKSSLDKLKSANLKKIIIIPLFPQYSKTTTGSCIEQVFKHLDTWKFIPEILILNQFCDKSFYIESYYEKLKNEINYDEPLIISYHGLPKKSLKDGDPYYCYCMKTSRLLTEKLNLDPKKTFTCFQSRFGFNEWLQPYLTDKIVELANTGYKNIQVICPSFVSDCIETLDEIGNEAKELFIKNGGGKLKLIKCLNSDKTWINNLSKYIINNI